MEARLGIPVALDNDANVGALGEKAFGAARGVDDLRYVRQPYPGVAGVAGEIGHVLSDPSSPICRCGNRGCLEALASPVSVAVLLERSVAQAVTVQRLLELVADGHRGARRAVAEAGDAVGRAVAMAVNILNPSRGPNQCRPRGAELVRRRSDRVTGVARRTVFLGYRQQPG
jgi:predicted NBD/HSP70 family sugar kinase